MNLREEGYEFWLIPRHPHRNRRKSPNMFLIPRSDEPFFGLVHEYNQVCAIKANIQAGLGSHVKYALLYYRELQRTLSTRSLGLNSSSSLRVTKPMAAAQSLRTPTLAATKCTVCPNSLQRDSRNRTGKIRPHSECNIHATYWPLSFITTTTVTNSDK